MPDKNSLNIDVGGISSSGNSLKYARNFSNICATEYFRNSRTNVLIPRCSRRMSSASSWYHTWVFSLPTCHHLSLYLPLKIRPQRICQQALAKPPRTCEEIWSGAWIGKEIHIVGLIDVQASALYEFFKTLYADRQFARQVVKWDSHSICAVKCFAQR